MDNPKEETSKEKTEPVKGWYAVHTYSGYENKVKTNLEKRIESMDMGDYIYRIMVPTEEVEEKKDDKVKINKRKVFPGYVLVEMIMTDDSWYVVRNTTGVTGFVGAGAKPVPLHEAEVQTLLRQQGMEEAKREVDYTVGDQVEILDQAWRGMRGRVSEIDTEKGKVTVMLSLFGGRETPVDLEYDQVFKV